MISRLKSFFLSLRGSQSAYILGNLI